MTKVEQRVDALVAAFDKWFQSYSPQGNEPLVRPERAIIKTFCYYLTQVNPDARPKLPVLEEKVEEDAQHPSATRRVCLSGVRRRRNHSTSHLVPTGGVLERDTTLGTSLAVPRVPYQGTQDLRPLRPVGIA